MAALILSECAKATPERRFLRAVRSTPDDAEDLQRANRTASIFGRRARAGNSATAAEPELEDAFFI